jgi:tRNA threonylcarbamoyladenosine biosynthesis protein TsaB
VSGYVPAAHGSQGGSARGAAPPSPVIHLLALDTTGEWGSIALVNYDRASGRTQSDEVALHSPEGFAHVLFGEIEALLARHSIGITAVDVFASATGPGSFTGVRVGLAAVKGLAEAAGRPAIGVSNLQALAAFGTRPLRAVVMDARRGEVYGGLYDAALRPLQPEIVAKLRVWLEAVRTFAAAQGTRENTGENALEFIAAGVPLAEAGVTEPVIEPPRALAAAIGRIALDRFLRGEACDPAQLDANYVRRSDAELFWKEPS